MKKILKKMGQVLQLVLVAPVKLPGKVGQVLKYLALGLGIVNTVLADDNPPEERSASDNAVRDIGQDTDERSAQDESE